jgi:mRNA interferase RelE/StbE
LKVKFKSSFTKDLRKVKNKSLLARVKETIEQVEQARNLQEIKNIKKLKGGDRYFCIRIGDYRIGLVLDGDTITFVRFLHRRDIYKYFP